MSPQAMPSPIELYEGAVQSMTPVIAATKPEQLSNPTPCSKWDVQGLINHNLIVAQFVHTTLAGTGADPGSMDDVSGPLPSEGATDAFLAGTNRVLEVIKAAGMLEKIVETPFGAMPAGHFLMIPFADIVIHKWDLAKATNQDTPLWTAPWQRCATMPWLRRWKRLGKGASSGPR